MSYTFRFTPVFNRVDQLLDGLAVTLWLSAVVIAADVTYRRGAIVNLKTIVEDAVRPLAGVRRVIVWRREGTPPSDPREVDWDDYAVAIPVFLTIVAMPLTFSIANGVSFGVISYAGLMLFSGRGRSVDPLLYGVAALLIVRYAWLS